MSRRKTIEDAMLAEFTSQGIEDTPTNRHDFLLGLRDGWLEDDDKSLEKSLYMFTINTMISMLALKITIQDK